MSFPSIYGAPDYQSAFFVQGFLPVTASFTTTLAVFGPGSARANNSDWVIEYPGLIPNLPANITINTAVVGANGVFPLALSAVTPGAGVAVLPVYLVSNSSGTTDGSLNPQVAPAMVIATAATNFVPAGFDMFVQVGVVIINTSGQLVPYVMNGGYLNRTIMFQDAQQVLDAGALVGPTKVDLLLGGTGGGEMPYLNIVNVNLLAEFTNNTADDTGYLIPHGLTSSSQAPIILKGSADTVPVYENVVMPVGIDGANAAIDYSVSATDCTLSLWVAGFTFCPAVFN